MTRGKKQEKKKGKRTKGKRKERWKALYTEKKEQRRNVNIL